MRLCVGMRVPFLCVRVRVSFYCNADWLIHRKHVSISAEKAGYQRAQVLCMKDGENKIPLHTAVQSGDMHVSIGGPSKSCVRGQSPEVPSTWTLPIGHEKLTLICCFSWWSCWSRLEPPSTHKM